MVILCNNFGVVTSPNVADPSTSCKEILMNLNMWSGPIIIIIWHGVRWISEALIRALFEVLSTESSTKCRKNEGHSKHEIQTLRALSYQPYSASPFCSECKVCSWNPVSKFYLSSQPAQTIPTAPPPHTHHTLQRIVFL